MSNVAAFPRRQQDTADSPGPRAPAPVFVTTETYDVWWLISILRRRTKLLLAVMTVIPILTALYVSSLPKQYAASSRLLIEAQRERVLGIEAVLPAIGGDNNTVQTEAEYIASREIAIRTVKSLGLMSDPEFNPELDEESRRHWADRLLPDAPDELLAPLEPLVRWIIDTTSSQPESRSGPIPVADTLALVTDHFLDRLTVEASRFARVITIRFRSTSPETAERVANGVADAYLRDNQERREDALRRASSFLTGRVSGLRQSVIDAERKLEQFRRDNGLVETGGATLLLQQITHLNEQLIAAETARVETEARFSQVRVLSGSDGGLESLDAVLRSNVITQLRNEETELRRRIAELQTQFQPRYPALVQARDQLAGVQAQVRAEVDRIAQSLRNEVQIARVREANLAEAIRRLQEKLEGQTDAEVTLRSLESEVEASRDLYELILGRLKATDVQDESVNAPEARIISRAVTPQSAVSPRRGVAVLASVLGAMVVGCFLVLIIEFAIRGFKTPQQLELATGLPVLAQIPLNNDVTRSLPIHRLVAERPGSSITQALRRLRTTITLSLGETEASRVVLVTSTIASEGKSSVVEGLATLSALAGRRVLVIDADMQNPTLHGRFGLANVVGLSEVLTGSIEIDDGIEFDPTTGLYFMSRGHSVPNPDDLLGSEAMEALLRTARRQFDLVIIDTAPVSSVGDALIITPRVDGVLFVVEWERTHREMVIQSLRDIYEIGENVLGLVLSKVDVRIQSFDSGTEYYYYAQDDRGQDAA
ncbi:MAG: polysaccharide biosynthesis tyrosine autokinase [Thalassobaculum sp.]|uniref:GumC family protein n=1 Tax=Thalassobaculum sp. TaxID=2022740 RepID=UPI0032EEF4E3